MHVHGKCHCGAIAYEADVDPNTVRICHCTDCQTLTGSAYRVLVRAPAAGFVLKSGTPKLYVRTSDSGAKRGQAFCPDCGTPLYAAALENPAFYVLRLGAIAERAALTPKDQVWCRSALPWSADLSSIERHERQ